MGQKLTRRQMLKALAVLGAATGFQGLFKEQTSMQAKTQADDIKIFLPLIQKQESTSPPPTGRVIHVHDQDATSWNFSTGYFWNNINQDVVNTMTDEGLKRLTNTSTIQAAWQSLLPGYSQGKKIAIRVNFNNTSGCDEQSNVIDAVIEPINALIRGMLQMGVHGEDIWILEGSRVMPARFRNGLLYPGVVLYDRGCANPATYESTDPSATVTFSRTGQQRSIADQIVNATYLINMPIMKDHGISGVTLGMKHHYGSIPAVLVGGDQSLHDYISPGNTGYSTSNNPIVELNQNTQIRDKTILIVGDGLYGALSNTNVVPSQWTVFGNDAPNSLFFSTDPVAIDCVMIDILDSEPGVFHPNRDVGGDRADDYMRLASLAGLGIFERGDPWGSGYSNIDYQKIEL